VGFNFTLLGATVALASMRSMDLLVVKSLYGVERFGGCIGRAQSIASRLLVLPQSSFNP